MMAEKLAARVSGGGVSTSGWFPQQSLLYFLISPVSPFRCLVISLM